METLTHPRLVFFSHGRRLRLHPFQQAQRHYVGVTNDLVRRIHEHREGVVKGFSKTHGLKLLVYYEQYDDIRIAIQREKTMKHWSRAWKVRLIHGFNPEWKDLYPSLF
jgi:putative endonuclease